MSRFIVREECVVTHGDHEWVEGGPRDHGRFHCVRCNLCMNPWHVVLEMRAYREALVSIVQAGPAWLDFARDWAEAVLAAPLKKHERCEDRHGTHRCRRVKGHSQHVLHGDGVARW